MNHTGKNWHKLNLVQTGALHARIEAGEKYMALSAAFGISIGAVAYHAAMIGHVRFRTRRNKIPDSRAGSLPAPPGTAGPGLAKDKNI